MFYVDPGGACLGWAEFVDGRLDRCGLSRTKMKDVGMRAAAHRAALVALGAYSGDVKCECMRFRPRKGKKGAYIPPQDLIELNLIAGHVGTRWLEPTDWKGMVPKKIHQPKILEALSKEELALVEAVMPPSLRHNVIDAIGIGLHDVGRLDKDKVVESCLQAEQLTKRIKELSASRSSRGTTSRGSSKTRGSKRRKPPSFITLPKKALVRTAPAK